MQEHAREHLLAGKFIEQRQEQERKIERFLFFVFLFFVFCFGILHSLCL